MQLILGPLLSTPRALLAFAVTNALTEELESRVRPAAAFPSRRKQCSKKAEYRPQPKKD